MQLWINEPIKNKFKHPILNNNLTNLSPNGAIV